MVKPPRCILTDEQITSSNDSKAHVIPSAIGGRLKPTGILTKTANMELGEKFDLPMIQAFQGLMTLINGKRDRGENQVLQVTDESGQRYKFSFGEPLMATEPYYAEETTPEGVLIQIKARNLRELRTLLGRVKAQHAQLEIDEVMAKAVVAREWPDGMLHSRLELGPRRIFPGTFVAASIFAAYCGHAPHPTLKEYVEQFDPEDPKLPPDTFYFMPHHEWASAPGKVNHIIVLVADSSRSESLVYFDLFGVSRVAVKLPYEGTEDVCFSYAVDVLTGAVVEPLIDENVISGTPWRATHQLGDDKLYQFTQSQVGRLIALALQRSSEAHVEAIMEKVLGSDQTRPLTATDLAGLLSEVAEVVLLEWRRPLVKVQDMEENLAGFANLCIKLGSLLSAEEQQQFTSQLPGTLGKLASALEHAVAKMERATTNDSGL